METKQRSKYERSNDKGNDGQQSEGAPPGEETMRAAEPGPAISSHIVGKDYTTKHNRAEVG